MAAPLNLDIQVALGVVPGTSTWATYGNQPLVDALVSHFELAAGTRVMVSGSAPLGRGLGTSSAVAMATIGAAAAVTGVSGITVGDLTRIAFEAEYEMGRGGGMDHVVPFSPGPCLLDGRDGDLPATNAALPSLTAGFCVIDSGIAKSAIPHLAQVRHWQKTDGERIKRYRRDASSAASRLWHGLKTEDPESIGAGLNEAHVAMRDVFDMSSPALERTRARLLAQGAWGVKVVGSGGGGCLVAYFPSHLDRDLKAPGVVQLDPPAVLLSSEPPGDVRLEVVEHRLGGTDVTWSFGPQRAARPTPPPPPRG